MAGMSVATGRPRHWAAVVGVAAIALTVGSSCATLARSSGTDDDEVMTARNVFETKLSFRDTFEQLVAMGYTPLFGAAEFVSCGDDTKLSFVPTVTGQLRTGDGRPSIEDDAERLRDAFEAFGWGDVPGGSTVPGTVTSNELGWEITFANAYFPGTVFFDPTLHVVVHDDRPEIDVTTTGACLPATAEEAEFFEAMGRWYLNNLIPNPPSTTEPLVTAGTAAS